MRIDFACEHSLIVADGADVVAECPTCHDRRVRDVKVRAPRFRGTCTGPCAEFDPAITASAVNLAPGGPLPLKKERKERYAD